MAGYNKTCTKSEAKRAPNGRKNGTKAVDETETETEAGHKRESQKLQRKVRRLLPLDAPTHPNGDVLTRGLRLDEHEI